MQAAMMLKCTTIKVELPICTDSNSYNARIHLHQRMSIDECNKNVKTTSMFFNPEVIAGVRSNIRYSSGAAETQCDF